MTSSALLQNIEGCQVSDTQAECTLTLCSQLRCGGVLRSCEIWTLEAIVLLGETRVLGRLSSTPSRDQSPRGNRPSGSAKPPKVVVLGVRQGPNGIHSSEKGGEGSGH